MTACRTDIDWSAKPEPWCSMGPALKAIVQRIADEQWHDRPARPFKVKSSPLKESS
jgi:hypothetical protein